ncbi:TPA: hypothetical protein CPT90_06715 [Candidatus Gastranaerophilales bacterium HUM_3]|nr:MAG TPA: hypothetical protein CPT90_06715 [Candidatus Gastranaerophilales bacterium HUM_3]DAA98982.1 MAG TPA: hypothetical protein CPT88_00525 [Candidatus Gastranaerophilales bacterium HUM_8]DAB09693.1 MAG TPA: hypothetical protein CPT95_03780 [Candidatus Gastranaerophilales bacterium HUM_15]DAB10348.1 MAG TPA: hypothetical protein CPT92_00195 [Candidatus Gastranaerophilales bacterium HUM_13]
MIIFNLYPYINKDPEKLPTKFDEEVLQKNLETIKAIIKHIDNPTVLCAWGAGIERKKYLIKNLEEIYTCFPANTVWKRIDKSKFNHPQHPLYAKENTKLQNFDIKKYLNKIMSK